MDDALLASALDALLAAQSSPRAVRAIEAGGQAETLWTAIEDSGFADALLPESRGGAGLGMSGVYPLLALCGQHLLPVPLAQTMVARALLAQHDHSPPPGPIVLAIACNRSAAWLCEGVTAHWVLHGDGQRLRLYDIRNTPAERLEDGSLDCRLVLPPAAAWEFDAALDLRALQALALAAQMAGAMRQVLAITLRHANERTQFGRSIGKFQAVQHQLSLMAEHVEAAAMAARLGCNAVDIAPDPLRCALAKAGASAAVAPVTAIAHAVHGAIGITEEYDLQLYTRRLHAWRVAAGSESFWHQRIGAALLTDDAMRLPDFVLGQLSSG